MDFSKVWIAISKILPRQISRLGLGQILEFNEICQKWDGELCSLYGNNFTQKTKPISLKNKILTVDCLSSAWAQELQLKQDGIISHLNKSLKKETIERIRFIS